MVPVEIMANRIDSRMAGLSTSMIVRLGSMLMVGVWLLFAALKLIYRRPGAMRPGASRSR
jgi:hypothetical protein